MDALINAAARALALGDLARARELLRAAARAFGPREAVARARCQVAEAEIAFADRELGWPVARLEAALATLEAHGDRLNAAQVRRLNDPPCPARARRP
ncbi:multidrug efflux pump subunit AcrA (membrane-fusion protein) [Pseudomonas citronellolis]|nr:multidrug efflux pump subunit AcrA (membrane-fusion protein) [Pseudomonas citronellolis]MCP1655826.1 multidrug efflux pump subunit AcrA (membrane-fusion protein) [Pseudomonas citronellolis]MCP1722876.1 multidrug efflux pump subunit AcrA (membrane-fusion protein) [Pseudomonas citronellolis]